MLFQATFRTKRGAIKDTEFAESGEAAAAAIFARRATCETVQVCNAYLDDEGRPRGNGSNIRWISRREMLRAQITRRAQS